MDQYVFISTQKGRDMHYDAIVFDFDGVLFTGRSTPGGVYEEATRDLLAAFGVRTPGTWPDSLERPDNAGAFRDACEQFDLPPPEAWAYREAAATRIEGAWIDQGKRDRYADTSVLDGLADEVDIGIASNNRNALVADCVRRFGWGEVVTAYRGRYPTLEEFEHRKPHPRFLRSIIDTLSVTTPLYVGDRASDLVTAERVGCDSVLIRRGGEDRPIDGTPTFTVSSLQEVVDKV